MDWNDLQHLFALAKHSTLPEAANALGVNRTTIARRISRLENEMGAKLVERIGRDLVLTDAGREAAASAEVIDGEFQSLQRRLFGRDQQLAGAIRITLTPAIGNLLAPCLAQFCAMHPELLLEVSSTNATEDLEMMESDVALRLTSKPPENLVGRRLATPMVGIYASQATARAIQDNKRKDKVVEVVSLFTNSGKTLFTGEVIETWVRNTLGTEIKAAMHSNSTDLIREYIAAGSGVAVLPCYVGEGDPRLCRIGETRQESFTELWLLYHPRLRRLHRFRAFTEYLVKEFDVLRPLFEGDPQTPGDNFAIASPPQKAEV
jgi:DNA-binding transcriptional LysR family regulator